MTHFKPHFSREEKQAAGGLIKFSPPHLENFVSGKPFFLFPIPADRETIRYHFCFLSFFFFVPALLIVKQSLSDHDMGLGSEIRTGKKKKEE